MGSNPTSTATDLGRCVTLFGRALPASKLLSQFLATERQLSQVRATFPPQGRAVGAHPARALAAAGVLRTRARRRSQSVVGTSAVAPAKRSSFWVAIEPDSATCGAAHGWMIGNAPNARPISGLCGPEFSPPGGRRGRASRGCGRGRWRLGPGCGPSKSAAPSARLRAGLGRRPLRCNQRAAGWAADHVGRWGQRNRTEGTA